MRRSVELQKKKEVCQVFFDIVDTFLATVDLKRRPVMPREGRLVNVGTNGIETLHPIPYDTRI